MTPFMQQVDELLSQGASGTSVATLPCVSRKVGEALHNQVELRALAEQLVCEANAILRDVGMSMDLVDSADSDRLAFTLSCGHNRVWVITDVVGRTARARLGAPLLGAGERQIAGPEALADLLLGLIATELSDRRAAV